MSACHATTCKTCNSNLLPGSLLKFSGAIDVDAGGAPVETILYDTGPSPTVGVMNDGYPTPTQRSFAGLATRLITSTAIPVGGTVTVQLFRDGLAIGAFSTVYSAGQNGVIVTPPAATGKILFTPGQSYAIRVTTAGFTAAPASIFVLASVGVS